MAAVETAFGKIGVAEGGSGDRAIVFLHGVGSDKSVWAPQLDHFGTSLRSVAFDYPGYGDSGPVGKGTTRDDYAAAILAAMDSLGIDRALAQRRRQRVSLNISSCSPSAMHCSATSSPD